MSTCCQDIAKMMYHLLLGPFLRLWWESELRFKQPFLEKLPPFLWMSIRHGQFGNLPPSNESWMNGDWREVYYSNANQPFWTSNGLTNIIKSAQIDDPLSCLVNSYTCMLYLQSAFRGLNPSSCICRRYLNRLRDFVPPIDWFRRLFGGRGRESIKRFSQKWWVAYWLDYVKGSDHGDVLWERAMATAAWRVSLERVETCISYDLKTRSCFESCIHFLDYPC